MTLVNDKYTAIWAVPQVAAGVVARAATNLNDELVKSVATLALAVDEKGKAEAAQATAENPETDIPGSRVAMNAAIAARTACAIQVTEMGNIQNTASYAEERAKRWLRFPQRPIRLGGRDIHLRPYGTCPGREE